MKVKNPVLPGFNPDPSFICVGNDFYIATSTFEYYPGVEIHHSHDLVNWKVISRPLHTLKHLNLVGNPASGGIWAPNLTYKDGMFYLLFTDVKYHTPRPFKDTHNYLTKATDILGPWSEPIYLNSSGFDPSLFHDDEKTYLLNMDWDYRGPNHFSGILLQELDLKTNRLMGESKKIFSGTTLGVTEGPNLYKINGYYYLFVAEGGTGYQHAVTVARSKTVDGPYELHPQTPFITTMNTDHVLQKVGHASICQAPNLKWYMAHLCSRPIHQKSILGRETAIQEIEWKEQWPYLVNNQLKVELNLETEHVKQKETIYTFTDSTFFSDFLTLRIPFNHTMFNLKERKGYLRIYGKESLVSRFNQALLVRKQEDFSFQVELKMDFSPTNYKQLAGLNYRYNENNQFYFYMTLNEESHLYELNIIKIDQGMVENLVKEQKVHFTTSTVYLRLVVDRLEGQFHYSFDGINYHPYGPIIDPSMLSDEYAIGFTGAMVGFSCIDMNNQTGYADFKYFTYKCNK